MAAEVLFVAAKDDDMPRFLRRTKGDDVPIAALVLSTILVQVMLVVTLFSEDAFNFALDLTSALTLIPFLLAAAYALKLALTRETYTEQPEGRTRELAVGALATLWPDASRAGSCSRPSSSSSWPCRSSGRSSVSWPSRPAGSRSEPPSRAAPPPIQARCT